MNNKPGTAFLCIVIIIMIAIIYSIKVIKTVSYTVTLASQREKYIKQWYATELLLTYATTWYKQEKESLTTFPKQFSISSWPPPGGNFDGLITIQKKNKHINILVDLLVNNKKVCSLERTFL